MVFPLLLVAAYFAFAFWKRKTAIAILPLFFPLYLMRLTVLGIPFTLLELFCYAVGLPVLIDLIKDAYHGRFKYNLAYGFIDILFLAAIIGVIIVPKETLMIDGVTIYDGRNVAFGILKGFILAPIVYFVSFIREIKTRKLKELALGSYLLSSCLLGVYGIYQTVTGDFITPDFRASGPFESANYLALYIGPACVAGFIYFWRAVREDYEVWKTLFRTIAFAVLFMALFMTKSYGAVIGVFAGIGFYILYSMKKKWRIISLCALFLIFAGIISLNYDSDKFSSLFEFEERSSSAVRVEVWKIASSFVKDNPVFGIGLGQFEPKYQLEASEILGHAPYEWVMLHPHNLYLMFWLSVGVFGLLAFLGLTYLGFRSKRSELYVVGASMLIVILVHGLFDVPFWKNDLSMIYWLILGILIRTTFASFEGRIVKGKGLGRKLGFPTINVPAKGFKSGVFKCRVELSGACYDGVMHKGDCDDYCEIHLFGLNKEVYGENVRVEVYDKLRDTVKFNKLTDLANQIAKDVEMAKKIDS